MNVKEFIEKCGNATIKCIVDSASKCDKYWDYVNDCYMESEIFVATVGCSMYPTYRAITVTHIVALSDLRDELNKPNSKFERELHTNDSSFDYSILMRV